MRVLVIDDNLLHQVSARQTLGGHQVMIAGTYDEAYKLLHEPKASQGAVGKELTRRGFKSPYDQDATPEEKVAAWTEIAQIERELCPPPSFDVVLSDLLMPASKKTMGPKGLEYVGKEMPVGFALSLMAVLSGAKYVAVVTDTNHHDHPASAMLDEFSSRFPHEYDNTNRPPRFVINGVPVGYYHSPMTHVAGTVCPDCNGTGRRCYICNNSGMCSGKDWGKVLAHLMA